MSIILGGSVVPQGEFSLQQYKYGTDITISCPGAFSAVQIEACGQSTTTCSINGTEYVGTCSNMCCNSAGSSACLSGCTPT
jgi:hypothetical protein